MSVYILGISAFYHDSAAALIKDGDIIAAAQEERFSRKKGDEGFPRGAVDFCLREAGIGIDDVSDIVFYDKPIVKFDRILASYIHQSPRGLASFLKAIPLWLKKKLWTEDLIQKQLATKKEILFTSHHQSHAASAFYPSPFDQAAIITADGAGEWSTLTLGVGQGNRIDLKKKLDFPHSLGLLYSAFTLYCGFKVNSGEYKLMGLAPYGRPVYKDLIFKELIRVGEDGSFVLNSTYFNYITGLKMISRKFEKLFGRKALLPDQKPDEFFMDIAASIQAVLDEIMLKIARYTREITGMDNLVMAGGVALNCVSNEKILKHSGFKEIWIQPASGDAGGALGAALFIHYAFRKQPRTACLPDSQKFSLLGPDYDQTAIQSALDEAGAKYSLYTSDQLYSEVAAALNKQKSVGWFQGRMEFGPRALGNRSILADPRDPEMQKKLNLQIKFRESFRPFAPAVLEEHASAYFQIDRPHPYMLLTAQLQKDKLVENDSQGKTGLDLLNMSRSVIPAVTHVDNSARVQTVSPESNPPFYRLLQAFYALTGCPVLINTSFNVRGEPIVCSPSDAYASFMGTNLDILVIGHYILYKNEQPGYQGYDQWKKTLTRD